MRQNLILDVDTQVDFMLREGALYVPDAESIIENIRLRMAELFMPVVSTVDEHEEDDEEFKTFPKHCVKGKMGSVKIPETIVYSEPYLVKGNWFTPVALNDGKQFIIPKRTYNIWDEVKGNPKAMMAILEYFRPTTVHVLGVATDICVLAAVKGLSDRVDKIILHTDCMKGLSTENEEKTLKEMLDLGNVYKA